MTGVSSPFCDNGFRNEREMMQMKTWKQLFVRHGWMLTEKEENVFGCETETELNLQFLFDCFEKANICYTFYDETLYMPPKAIPEEKWLEAVDFEHRGRGEGLWFNPCEEQPKVRELDTYISGVVRQLNRLGFHTMGSCDGHGRRAAHVIVTKDSQIESLVELLLALGMKRVYTREMPNAYHLTLHLNQKELLDLAEKLSHVEGSWVGKGYGFFKRAAVSGFARAIAFDSGSKRV
jgi:tripeptide aminopeptidase